MAGWLNAIKPKIMEPVLYLDLGSNLGIHGLHAAKSNCSVWAVEPQEENLQRVILRALGGHIYRAGMGLVPQLQCRWRYEQACFSEIFQRF